MPAGPWQAVLFASGFDGSEDLAFDGNGGLALKRGGDVVVVAADLSETVVASNIPKAYGTRYLADGRLAVALPQDGKVVLIEGDGTAGDFLTMLASPNGLFRDLEGGLWVTDFGGDRVLHVTLDLEVKTLVMGAEAATANGVVYDAARGLLFYTNYVAGQVQRVALDEQGDASAPVLVAKVPGAALDGLTMDICGTLYAVDQGAGTLYRVVLDEDGAMVAGPEAMVTFDSNVANAQFGEGAGFDEQALYLSGNPGDVYRVAVGVPGVPTFTL